MIKIKKLKKNWPKKNINILKTDSWGFFHIIEIACILFNISIGIYIDNGNNEYNRYSYSENINENVPLLLLSFHNNNHFNILYDKNNEIKYEDNNHEKKILKTQKNVSKNNVKYQGKLFENKYVLTKYKGSENIYDQIFKYLNSIKIFESEIKKQKEHPKWHLNQILSCFNLEYPEDIKDNNLVNKEKRKKFRKEASKYVIDKHNRLNIINPLKNTGEKDSYYKIPFAHEKEILVKETHFKNNHCGRIACINYLHSEKWYWYGMNRDISEIIKICAICNKPNKFKSLNKKIKLILDNGPHYRYVADIWYLIDEIKIKTGFNYILDIIDHFSKWYNGYLLKTKEAHEVLKKIEIFIENFGKCKILQVDNGTEFKNNLLHTYCKNNNISIIHSSPYHPQSNGVVEVVHKEIRKYIYNEYFLNKDDFDIEEELFNITKLHNNKKHSTTNRIPREIRDIEEIEEINNNIKHNLLRKIKNYDIVEYNKFYVIDFNKIYINDNKILKKKGKIKKYKVLIKIPIIVLSEYNDDNTEYIIEIKKDYRNLKEGSIYIISIDNLEEVDAKLWKELINH